ncbi:Cdc25 phosphatase Ibp1 [Thecaphora frezii]
MPTPTPLPTTIRLSAASLAAIAAAFRPFRTPSRQQTSWIRADAQRLQRYSELRAKFDTTMSFTPLYRYIDRDTLAEKIRAQGKSPHSKDLAVVDVRDDDFEGGNIVGAQNIPSTKIADSINDLVLGPLKEYKQVVFHCHLSQQRGPKAAGNYAKARDEAIRQGKLPNPSESSQQEVLVLRGGFSEFQDKYKKDPEIVEKYDEDSWALRG